MLKIIFVSSFIIFSFISCQEGNISEPFNYVSDTPSWLKDKIDNMSANPEYFGTKVYRYVWNNKFVYHIMIPIGSCGYCELYEQSGIKINFVNDAIFEEFLENKTNETLVWEWNYN